MGTLPHHHDMHFRERYMAHYEVAGFNKVKVDTVDLEKCNNASPTSIVGMIRSDTHWSLR